ncbi:MAG TPA: hypothetical protein DDW89_08925, partial [Gammaproteobacteria bacterium]|nr:hypothetical protein [Gammaproteobacteria bacterium]
MTMVINYSAFTHDCTGDVCTGDVILFSEAVFGGSHRRPTHLGERTIVARVLKDSYGAERQQHTFTLEVIACEGVQPIEAGTRTTRKGRNVYRNGCRRMPWQDESQRREALNEKHTRGDAARAERAERRA